MTLGLASRTRLAIQKVRDFDSLEPGTSKGKDLANERPGPPRPASRNA